MHKLIQASVRRILTWFFVATDHIDPWINKDSDDDYDVTMGSYNRVEVCELPRLFALSELSKKFDKGNIGLYRGDGLPVFKNYNVHQNEEV